MRRAVALALVVAATASAQEWAGRGFRLEPPRMATAGSFDGAFSFCRVMYRSVRREPRGQGWRTDYPNADINLSIRLGELTKMRVSTQPSGEPNHLVVRITDDALFRCPFLMLEDAGTAAFTDEEIVRLRAYFQKGGFMWVDDFWGSRAWNNWSRQLARVLPPDEYPLQDVPLDHPIFHALYDVTTVPQIPSIQFWRESDGQTSELGSDSAEPHARGVFDRQGRLLVFITHNTDVSDAWEREGEDPEFFYRFSPRGYEVGVNVLLFAMTH